MATRRETPTEAAVDYRDPQQVIDLILAVAFKHEIQYWRDFPGTDAERLAKIVEVCRRFKSEAR